MNAVITRPQVGIGVLLVKQRSMLLGKRRGAHASGVYATPGGHLEHGQDFAACVLQEILEEAGGQVRVTDIRPLCITNVFVGEKQYVDIGMFARWVSGEPENIEEHKCEGWGWFDMGHLPLPMFVTIPNYITALQTGQAFFPDIHTH